MSDTLTETIEITLPHQNSSSDNAITGLDEDGLDRRKFAITIADSIAKRLKKPSYVIGLLGAWGCGKTSLKNMILDRLHQLPKNQQPIVVEFNPWQFRNEDALFGMFFEQIAVDIGQKDKVTANKLRDYSKTLILGGSVAASLLAVAATGGVTASVLALTLSQLLNSTGEVAAGVAKQKEEALGDLQAQKKRLSEMMKGLQSPVLVVIDDIDRLYAQEIALIFQLVKANADFPNFTYLLLYDQDIVAKSLEDKVIAGSGHEYLEKIVQFPIDIPQPKREKICQAWIKGVRRVFQNLKVKTPEIEAWYESLQAAHREGLHLYLQNLRDVWRVLNTMEFSLPVLVTDDYLDVDLVDFVMMTILRIHEPNVFALLPLYKAALTGDKKTDIDNRRRNSAMGQSPHPYQIQMETLLQSASVSENPFQLRALHKILKDIFPDAPWPQVLKLSATTGDQLNYEDFLSWRKSTSHLSVRTAGNFDRYFVFSLSEETIAESEVEAIIKSQDRRFLFDQFQEWEAQNRLSVWLERIYSSVSNTATLCSDTFLITLLEIGDTTRDRFAFRYSRFSNVPCMVILEALSNKQGRSGEENIWSSTADISSDFLEVIQRTPGVLLPVQCIELIRWIFDQTHNTIRRGKALVSQDALNQCCQICAQRISDMAQQRVLSDHLHVDYLVGFWRGVDETAAQEWVNNIQEDTEQLFSILRAWSASFNSIHPERLDLAELLLFMIPLVKIEELLNDYHLDGTDDINAPAVRLMRELLPGIQKFNAESKAQANAESANVIDPA